MQRAKLDLQKLDESARTLEYSQLPKYMEMFVAQNPTSVGAIYLKRRVESPAANNAAVAEVVYEKRALVYLVQDGQVVELTYSFPAKHYGAVFEHATSDSISLQGVTIARSVLTSVTAERVAEEERLAAELVKAYSMEAECDEEFNIASNQRVLLEPKPPSEEEEEDGFYDDDADPDQFAKTPEQLTEMLDRFSKTLGKTDQAAFAIDGFMIAFGSCLHVQKLIGANVISFDGGHLNLIKAKFVVVSSTCSQGNSLPLGFAVCPGESECDYLRLSFILGLAGFVPTKTNVFASDQGKAVEAALTRAYPTSRHLSCIVHIARVAQRHGRPKLSEEQLQAIYHVQKQPTQMLFAQAFQGLAAKVSPDTLDYLKSLDLRSWAAYTFFEEQIPLNGLKTSNQAEVVMAMMRILGFRRMDGTLCFALFSLGI